MQDGADDSRPTQSRDTDDVTSGPDAVATPPSSAARAEKQGASRQSDTAAAAAGCHGNGNHSNGRTPSGVVKDEKDEDVKVRLSPAGVTSLKELESAGRTSSGKLDDVKARLT